MKDPDKLWMDLVYRFALQSKCRSRQVGCIIVSPDQRVVGQGFNGAPKGSSCEYCVRCDNKAKSGQDLEHAVCAHAEANAIGYAANAGISTANCALYCTTQPCAECAKLIIAAGIKTVVFYELYLPEYYDSMKVTFNKAGVEFKHGRG